MRSPTGATPQQIEKRSIGTTKNASRSQQVIVHVHVVPIRGLRSKNAAWWSSEFVMKKGFLKDWPHTKKIDFWEGAAKFIEQHGFAKRTSK